MADDPPAESSRGIDGARPTRETVTHKGEPVTLNGEPVYQTSSPTGRVHHLQPQDLTTPPPEIGSPTLKQMPAVSVRNQGGWGQGLSDREGCEKLRAMMLNVAKGQRHISEDRNYERLRAHFMKKPHLKSRSPRLLLQFENLNLLQEHLRSYGRADRSPLVESDWLPLLNWLASLTVNLGHDSSSWTGSKDAAHHVRVIRRISANALMVVDQLILEADHRFGNGGPIEPVEQQALDTLREFRDALSGLIHCLEKSQPIQVKMSKLKALGERAFASLAAHMSGEGEIALPMASMLAYASAVATIAPMVSSATYLQEAAFAATAGGYLQLKKKASKT